MQRLPLIGGAYSARSILANCQRCINLFPEINRQDSPTPFTNYQRPGLKPLVSPAAPAPGRALYQASNGDGYAVIGQNLYYVSPPPAWTLTALGPLTAGRNNPCSMIDNSIELLVVDGAPAVAGLGGGWRVDLASHGMTAMSDPAWTGADRVDYLDTFIIWNQPGTKRFGSTLSNQIVPLDPLYLASKTNYPDNLRSLIVNRHEILLLGMFKSEIWYDAGNPQFPFAELPGASIEHGVEAKYSLATADIATYWLGRDLQSGRQGMVFRQRGYETKRISNHALEYQMQQLAKTTPLSDAVGFTYQQGGHVFYELSFPSGNQTWVFDESISDIDLAWSQRCWTSSDGQLNRSRSNVCAALYGYNVTLDWENGTLYQLDLDTYTDTVAGVSGPITYLRTFPHLMSGLDAKGNPVLANGKMIQHDRFLLDAECGTGPDLDAEGLPPKFNLRWSDDRGRTWGEAVLQSSGELGQYSTRPEWAGLGQAMDRVYEVSWSFPGPVSLQGAWVEGKVLAR